MGNARRRGRALTGLRVTDRRRPTPTKTKEPPGAPSGSSRGGTATAQRRRARHLRPAVQDASAVDLRTPCSNDCSRSVGPRSERTNEQSISSLGKCSAVDRNRWSGTAARRFAPGAEHRGADLSASVADVRSGPAEPPIFLRSAVRTSMASPAVVTARSALQPPAPARRPPSMPGPPGSSDASYGSRNSSRGQRFNGREGSMPEPKR